MHTVLTITSADDADLTPLLDAIIDGRFESIAAHDDLSIEQGSTSLLGDGSKRTARINVKYIDVPAEKVQSLIEHIQAFSEQPVLINTIVEDDIGG